MIYPSPDRLDKAGSKYALVIVAAKRARQLKDGARKLVNSASSNPLTVALEELAEGAIVPLQVGGPEKLPDATSKGPVLQGLLASLRSDALDDPAALRALTTGDDEAEYSADDIEYVGLDDEEDEIVPLGEEADGDVALADHDSLPQLDDEIAEDVEDIVADDDEDAAAADDTEVSLAEVAEAEEAGADEETEE